MIIRDFIIDRDIDKINALNNKYLSDSLKERFNTLINGYDKYYIVEDHFDTKASIFYIFSDDYVELIVFLYTKNTDEIIKNIMYINNDIFMKDNYKTIISAESINNEYYCMFYDKLYSIYKNKDRVIEDDVITFSASTNQSKNNISKVKQTIRV